MWPMSRIKTARHPSTEVIVHSEQPQTIILKAWEGLIRSVNGWTRILWDLLQPPTLAGIIPLTTFFRLYVGENMTSEPT